MGPIPRSVDVGSSPIGRLERALVFECNRWQACRFAGRFLSTDPPDAVNDEVRDLLGELANMIGGNLKCAVVAGLSLSMPSVTDEATTGSAFVGPKSITGWGLSAPKGPSGLPSWRSRWKISQPAGQAIDRNVRRNSFAVSQ